jgi:hypothetical protein
MVNQAENFRDAILKKKARIEEINLILAQPIPKSATTNSRRRLIGERLHLGQEVSELERGVARLESPTARLLELPEGLRSSGDPVGQNPFAAPDPRHEVWDEATHRAEEEWCRFNSEVYETDVSTPSSLIDSVCSRFVRKFDIWAKRSVHVVWSDTAVRAYDQWLISYAEAWLRDVSVRKLYAEVVPLDDLLTKLKLVLIRRVEWWKAEARRYVAEQKAALQSAVTQEAACAPLGTDGKTDRRAAVDAYIDEVFKKTGRKVTRTDIWKTARYRTRTEFERWERKDPRNPNRAAHERFTRILAEKPHLK